MKSAIITVLLIFPLLYSCQKDDDNTSFQLGAQEIFKIETDYYSARNQISFNILEVNDSRCPINANCFWQGEAIVKIEFERPENTTIELSTYDNLIDTVGNYSVTLVKVEPYPELNTTDPEVQKITLQIAPL